MFYLMGVDPGTNFLSMCVLGIDDDFKVCNVNIHKINLSNIKPYNINNNPIAYKIMDLIKISNRVIREYDIVAISIENPFSYGRSPGSVIPLAKAVGAVEVCFMEYDKTRLIRRVSPTQVKKFIGAKKVDEKDAIYEALKINEDIKGLIDLSTLNDDENDSIAIALELLSNIKENPYKLL